MSEFDKFLKWFATSPLASALRVFVGFVLAEVVQAWLKVGDFDMSNWKSWVIGGIAVAVPILLRWLNPADKAYGYTG